MADISFEVFDALKSVGVEDEKARRAAEALSGAATRTAFSDLTAQMARVESTLRLHTWMLGIIAVAAMGTFVQGLFQQ